MILECPYCGHAGDPDEFGIDMLDQEDGCVPWNYGTCPRCDQEHEFEELRGEE